MTQLCMLALVAHQALLHIADKYCIEDIVKHCLQWMQDQFTARRSCWTELRVDGGPQSGKL